MARIGGFICALTLSAPAAFAQDAGGTGWQIGIFAFGGTSPYVGQDTDARVIPFLSYSGARFSVGVDGASYTLFENGGATGTILASPRFAPYDDDDSAELAGLDRDVTLDLGFGYRFETGNGLTVSAQALQEITGEHEGRELDIQAAQRLGDWPVSVYAGATWQSSDLAGYLYGVGPGEVAAGRPAYDPGNAVTTYIGVRGFLPINESTAVIGSVEAQQFNDAITDSPITDDNGAVRATLGLSFRF